MKQMIKRKDGSTSQRGLWDNIRANKGSGKKPTAQMLKQEKKIKKGQNGLRAKADATRVEKPAVNSRPATKYKYIDTWMDEDKKPSSLDSSEYRSGYKEGISGKGTSIFGSLQRHMGALEGKENYKKNSIKKEKTGGKIKKAKNGAWQRAEGKNPSGGLNAKGRASYNKANPGKPGLKAPQPEGGPRKKSFCARMSGMKKKLTSAKTANDPNSRINKSLRKWKC
jgi:hypothetical protein